jgi:hypothetical protein
MKQTMDSQKIWHSIHYTAGVADLQIKNENGTWTLVLTDGNSAYSVEITDLFRNELALRDQELLEKIEGMRPDTCDCVGGKYSCEHWGKHELIDSITPLLTYPK